ncbi:MAG: methyltransferase domain-containing protein [Vicinamibacterales bacterium]
MTKDLTASAEPGSVQSTLVQHRSCRGCGALLRTSFVDLGMSPLCESYVSADRLDAMEAFYPLHVLVCDACLLVQLSEYVAPTEIFSEYAYFSSFSSSWLAHCRHYVEEVTTRYALTRESVVIEVASNDGYLLQYFHERGIPVLGIEPAANVAKVAEAKGIPTRVEFFGRAAADRLVASGYQADLVVGNNVLAQVPDLNDFVGGLARVMKADGVLTLEVPHLLTLIDGNQFDTIYHEHFSYFSLFALEQVLERHGLMVVDVEELATHGGSLRIHVRHADRRWTIGAGLEKVRADESRAGMTRLEGYAGFAKRVEETKRALLQVLIDLKQCGKTVVGYGAPGKGNTLLNYCGIRTDFIDFVVDRNPYKQGRFLPGTHIPIRRPEDLDRARPDYVLILPWNLKTEIMEQLAHIRAWGGAFIVPIPRAEICG